MTLKLYYDLMSQPARAIYMFLRANNIKFEEKRVDLKNGMCELLERGLLFLPYMHVNFASESGDHFIGIESRI